MDLQIVSETAKGNFPWIPQIDSIYHMLGILMVKSGCGADFMVHILGDMEWREGEWTGRVSRGQWKAFYGLSRTDFIFETIQSLWGVLNGALKWLNLC